MDLRKEECGGYIFVSHSHRDIKQVRKIRNYLEEKDLNPILFYLRCMDGGDTEEQNELRKLIHKEIDSREWFLIIDSPNARNSEWVKDEIDYISSNKQKIVKVDLENEFERITSSLDKMIRKIKVFILYSYEDTAAARKITEKLENLDYMVLNDPYLSMGEVFNNQIKEAISELSEIAVKNITEKGCFIALITKNSIKSEYFKEQLQKAAASGKNIQLVIIGNVEIPDWIELLTGMYRYAKLDENFTDEQFRKLMDSIYKAEQ